MDARRETNLEVYLMVPPPEQKSKFEIFLDPPVHSPAVEALISGIKEIKSTEEKSNDPMKIEVTPPPKRTLLSRSTPDGPVAEMKITVVDGVNDHGEEVEKTTAIKFNLVDTEEKHTALQAPLSLRTERVLVFPIDNSIPLEEQYKKFQEMLEHKPVWASRVIVVLPDTTENQKKLFLETEARQKFSAHVDAADVVFGAKELFVQLNKSSRTRLFHDYIETQVIAILEKEQKRLAAKYDLKFSNSEKTIQVDNHTFTHREKIYKKDEGLASKDLPGNARKSNETEEHRQNAIKRCQAIEVTISELREKLAKTKANEVNNLNLPATLESFQDIVKKNIVGFDKRPGILGWGSKFGRVVLNVLVGVLGVVGAPLALEAFKKKVVSMEEKPNSGWTKTGKMLGLTTDTGKWFRLQGKSAYEGSKAAENIKIGSKVIEEQEREEASKLTTPRKPKV